MRILVYGAGVLGCNLAHDLYRAKKDVTINRKKCYSYFKMLCATFIGKMAISDHAMSAVNEMRALSADFQELKKKSGMETPNWDFWEKNVGTQTFE